MKKCCLPAIRPWQVEAGLRITGNYGITALRHYGITALRHYGITKWGSWKDWHLARGKLKRHYGITELRSRVPDRTGILARGELHRITGIPDRQLRDPGLPALPAITAIASPLAYCLICSQRFSAVLSGISVIFPLWVTRIAVWSSE